VSPSDSLVVDPSTVDGKLDVRDTHKVRTQVEYCCSGGQTAELTTTIAVSRFDFVRLHAA